MGEKLSGGQGIPDRRETVAAFVGFAPRGPIGIPIAIRGLDEYRKRFGSNDRPDRLGWVLAQYFANGGGGAIIVRVCPESRRCRITMAGPSGALVLEARNPGPCEYLRASVDYDHIGNEDDSRFNLVIHRLTSPSSSFIEEQEIFPGVSVDPADSEFIGHALRRSNLVKLDGDAPGQRPESTHGLGTSAGQHYVCGDSDWDGTGLFTDYDLVGSVTESTGLYALEQLSGVDLVCMVPGSESQELGPVALFSAERYCRRRNAMLLIDPPLAWTCVADVRAHRRDSEFSSPNVATYFPRLAPRGSAGSDSLSSALGAIAGWLVTQDRRIGIGRRSDSEALSLRSRNAVQQVLSAEDCDHLLRAGVNPLRPLRAGRLRFEGLATFARGSGFRPGAEDLYQRRLELFVVGSIARGTRWAACEDNVPRTWAEVRRQVADFLQAVFEPRSKTGKMQSYYVICDQKTNASSRPGTAGGTCFIVGFSLPGGEPVAYRFAQDARECRVRELFWPPTLAMAS